MYYLGLMAFSHCFEIIWDEKKSSNNATATGR